MKITFLGTGTSHGIPVINCDCEVCRSEDPRDKRLRTSVSIEHNGHFYLIDTSVDLRQQLLRNPVPRIDAVFYTHTHADHILGFDDLRVFNYRQKKEIPVYGNQQTIEWLSTKFDYAFSDAKYHPGAPRLKPIVVNGGLVEGDLQIEELKLYHGKYIISGFRFNNFAYCTDVSRIPAETLTKLKDLDVLALGALRLQPHPTHFNLKQAVKTAGKIAAKKTYLIHMNHTISHQNQGKELPENIEFAFDGLEIECN